MKKVLLGTTALAALVALPMAAQSAEKIKLGLGGYYRAMVVFGDQDDGVGEPAANIRDHGLARESEVYFSGKTTLDNGIKVGVMIQLEGETSGDQIDNSYIWTAGGFGRIEFGSTWDPGLNMSAGSIGEMIDSHGDFGSHNHAAGANGLGLNTYTGNAGIAGTPNDVIVYYSPRMSGFQLGVSYSADDKGATGADEDGTALDSELDPAGGSTASEMLVVAANYIVKFDQVSVKLFGAYATAETEATAAGAIGAQDVDGFSLGAQISMSGFTIGGRWTEHEDLMGIADTDKTAWRIGVAYAAGPWSVGANYIDMEQDVTATTEDETTYLSIGASYNVGPGIKLFGGVQFYDYEDSTGLAAVENDATVGVFGTKLSF